eukprot:GHVP01001303.1.p1 GENE.GHVP01001303.1~~GHVP01001303.1.p1  ORF type:complete len:479 (+),score=84.77 GHVP01001303.1:167-1603(+)
MNDEIVIRVVSNRAGAGMIRITSTGGSTVQNLKEEVSKHFKILPANFQLSLDQNGSKILSSAKSTLRHYGLQSGAILFLILLAKESAPELSGVSLVPKIVNVEEKVPLETKSDPAAALKEEKTSDEKTEPIFQSFDIFLRSRDYNTVDLPQFINYKSKPLEKGVMNKLVPSISLKHQPYRHCDHLEVLGFKIMGYFVQAWQKDMVQAKFAYMLGYFEEDHHYPMGIRAVMETLYEPAGIQFEKGTPFPMHPDPFLPSVEALAGKLDLRIIGCVFTHLTREEHLTAQEVIRFASLQASYTNTQHYTKCPVTPFVISTVSPAKGSGQPQINAYMISDLGLALVRDGVISTKPNDSRHVFLKEAKEHEICPEILQEGKPTKEFDCDWLIVRVNESAPINDDNKTFTHCTFLPPRSPQLKTSSISEHIREKGRVNEYHVFADFNLLLHITKTFDVETCASICQAILKKTGIDPDLFDILCGV